MVLLCTAHHRLHHQGEYAIRMVEGIPRFEPSVKRIESAAADYGPDPASPAPCRASVPPRGDSSDHEPGSNQDSGAARRSGERLTSYALGVYVEHLLLAA
jgi:hypothetical protein